MPAPCPAHLSTGASWRRGKAVGGRLRLRATAKTTREVTSFGTPYVIPSVERFSLRGCGHIGSRNWRARVGGTTWPHWGKGCSEGGKEADRGKYVSLSKAVLQRGSTRVSRGVDDVQPSACKSPPRPSLTGHLGDESSQAWDSTGCEGEATLRQRVKIPCRALGAGGEKAAASAKQCSTRTRVLRTPGDSRRGRLARFKPSTGRRRIEAEGYSKTSAERRTGATQRSSRRTHDQRYGRLWRHNEEVGNEAAGLEEPESHSEVEVLKMKIRLRELELEIAREQRGSGPTPRGNGGQESHGEMRHFSKLISSVLPMFPTEAEVPVWFEAAESALEGYEVPKAWWGQIIFPFVEERIPFLSTRLAPPQHRDYEVLKGAVLEEMKLSAGEYLRRFHRAKKRAAEGWRAFATRLQSYLQVRAKLTMLPLALARGTGVFADGKAAVPVLCALTNKLRARTDCLLSEEAWTLLKEADRVRQQTAHAAQPDRRAKPSGVRVSEAVLAFDEQCSGKMFPKRKGPGRVRGRHRWRRRRGKGNTVVAGAPGLERSAHHRKGSAHVNEGTVLRVPNACRYPSNSAGQSAEEGECSPLCTSNTELSLELGEGRWRQYAGTVSRVNRGTAWGLQTSVNGGKLAPREGSRWPVAAACYRENNSGGDLIWNTVRHPFGGALFPPRELARQSWRDHVAALGKGVLRRRKRGRPWEVGQSEQGGVTARQYSGLPSLCLQIATTTVADGAPR
ncbi:hypothetical protein HPB52_013573 [Rhipicephalus sanguineus]|uniref:Uncharacterized protein n=1 Tax=Rhipicephalus sanguineus TaxID=34632 RepID=A0A9D4PRM5_RHISA|nr:hypothetical protein HPB52_013573 [Rhipicephalus sanguineus]